MLVYVWCACVCLCVFACKCMHVCVCVSECLHVLNVFVCLCAVSVCDPRLLGSLFKWAVRPAVEPLGPLMVPPSVWITQSALLHCIYIMQGRIHSR